MLHILISMRLEEIAMVSTGYKKFSVIKNAPTRPCTRLSKVKGETTTETTETTDSEITKLQTVKANAL